MQRLNLLFILALVGTVPVGLCSNCLLAQSGPSPSNEAASSDEPAPAILSAIDLNQDGQLSAEELQGAPRALLSLDKNRNGTIAGKELLEPPLRTGGGGPGGPGRGGPGRGGFGGRGFGPPGGFNPSGDQANATATAPEDLKFKDGAATIPNLETFHKMAYRGEDVLIDTQLADLEFVKFTLDAANSDNPQLYFINTKNHRAHPIFARVVGLPFMRGGGQMKGVLIYRPSLRSPSGQPGAFTYEFEPNDAYSAEMIEICQKMLTKKMPILAGNVGYYPRFRRAFQVTDDQADAFAAAGLTVYQDEDLTQKDVAYLPLNLGETFGRLRLMGLDEYPGPRDVVLYESLPNELSRVAGIITAVRQTPLSHVNLRAVQDKVPNAFIADAAKVDRIKPLIGKLVAFKVTNEGFMIREASAAEVESHFEALRPSDRQVPKRNLAVREARSLDDVAFADSDAFGVKAANVAAMRTFNFKEGTAPEGYAIPFYFYDEFMKHNGFYERIEKLISDSDFANDSETQQKRLKEIRKLIEDAEMPGWMLTALDALHKSFPEGSSVRVRSSTNNEDLPGFSGAGLYDSFTHKPDEGHFSKSVKQVYASMWNYRAFEERAFYRVDHMAAAMGVLVHPNYKGELANGVAVTADILYQTYGNYYVNVQAGEDLVTNPDEQSVPEEGLLDWYESDKYQVVRVSNRARDGGKLLSSEHIDQLRRYLATIHARYAKLYSRSLEAEDFAMEIEFKVTSDNRLVIKQARPWVFAQEPIDPPPMFALMKAIDRDGNSELSKAEIDEATNAAIKLDANEDGNLQPSELGWPVAQD
ncbi:MAG: PEP/pyruvate-binding domain-containing protein [Planctomycetota bacterium]